MDASKTYELALLADSIKTWSRELGFQQTGISDIDLALAEQRLNTWLQNEYHGEMHYMEKHGSARSHPEELVVGTLRVISVRLDYLPEAWVQTRKSGEKVPDSKKRDRFPRKLYFDEYGNCSETESMKAWCRSRTRCG